jgi:DNA-binding NtrC family response regulator
MNSKLKILVIDDDAVIGRSFERVLCGKGFEVSTAMTGEQALRDINRQDFDVVFTDIRMPGMDGLEVAERIKAKCPWTPVVVVTGYGTTENQARASVLGVSGFVQKPLTPEIIESITIKALVHTDLVRKAGDCAEAVTRHELVKAPEIGGWMKVGLIAKNIGLFFAAPFIALAYIVALPVIGFFMFAKLGYQAFANKFRSM